MSTEKIEWSERASSHHAHVGELGIYAYTDGRWFVDKCDVELCSGEADVIPGEARIDAAKREALAALRKIMEGAK